MSRNSTEDELMNTNNPKTGFFNTAVSLPIGSLFTELELQFAMIHWLERQICINLFNITLG